MPVDAKTQPQSCRDVQKHEHMDERLHPVLHPVKIPQQQSSGARAFNVLMPVKPLLSQVLGFAASPMPLHMTYHLLWF